MKHRWASDRVIVALVFAGAAWWGTHYARASGAAGRPPAIPREIVEPAVLMVCGYGFHAAENPPLALARFIEQADDRFSCDELPRPLRVSSRPLLTGSWLYLVLLVAGAWAVFGISFSGLAPVFGVLLGLTSLCAYLIFRLGMGRLLATACTFAFSISSLNVLNLANFRDYARAPFMLALIGLALLLGLRRFTPRRVIALCASYGAIAGVGYGVRTDVIVELPLLVATVLLFLPWPLKSHPGVKGAALLAAAAAFAVASWPLRNTAQSGSNLWHVALIGFMPEYGEALGVENATYHWGARGSDEFVELAVGSYARRIHPEWPALALASREYEVATRSYYGLFLRRFPADMVTRTLASIVRMPELPFGWADPPLPGQLDRLYAIRKRVLRPLYGYGIVATLTAIIAMALARPREGLFLSYVFAYVAGYPAIQFHNRHFFYLEVIGWLSIGFLVAQMMQRVRGPAPTSIGVMRGEVFRRAAVGSVAVACFALALMGLRLYQARVVRHLIAGYLRAPAVPLGLEQHDREATHVATVPAFDGDSATTDWSRLLRIEMNADACSGATLTFHYDSASPYRWLTSSVAMPAAGTGWDERFVLFEPVYTGFGSVDLNGARSGCLHSVQQVAELDDEPLWLPLLLDAHWQTATLYQTVRTRENIH